MAMIPLFGASAYSVRRGFYKQVRTMLTLVALAWTFAIGSHNGARFAEGTLKPVGLANRFSGDLV